MSANDQVNFLLACIKHNQNGAKIDFEAVAKELSIPTKAAAAKRYERIKKRALTTDLSSSGVDGGGGSQDDGTSTPSTPKRAGRAKGTPTATPASAKRKRAGMAATLNQSAFDGVDESANGGGGGGGGAADEDDSDGDAKKAKLHAMLRPKREHAQKAARAIKLEADADEADELDEEAEEQAEQAERENGKDNVVVKKENGDHAAVKQEQKEAEESSI
ncbi:hypothetical protein SPI_03053 [Niveomyces insectorum RCEF 264]|uniref:Myb-like DNA-binding domain-containing protein n=1 Tax=Niveomyces insectorum RCEF 264 TaxID=1081102 RepID=A0A167X150_9HYPO|nr:hypothetical protein SPI_03053 [Niveomyces insectorum RCEF 264]